MGRIAIGQVGTALTTTDQSLQVNLVASGTYRWLASGSGTNEYYMDLNAGGDPGFSEPLDVLENSVSMTPGTAGSLAAGEWDYADNDSLGYSVVYVRLSDGADPDSKADGYVQGEWAQLTLKDSEGYKFRNAVDKIYVEGDEIDYESVSAAGLGDNIEYLTNISANHGVDAYVTQYNTLTAPTGGSLKASCMEIWRDTLWYSGIKDEVNVLRYGKTIAGVSDILTGNLHNFSDGNNYLVGDGGEVTALQATEDRLYVFQKHDVHYITITITSTGTEGFSRMRRLTGNYGTPNPFCVTEMEDVVIFFTGKRLIRIGYEPNSDQILPDELFDKDILPIFRDADEDQSNASLHYNPATKKLYITFSKGGSLITAVYDNQTKVYAYPYDHDPSSYVFHGKSTYFGSQDDDITYRIGTSYDHDDVSMIRRLKSGRMDDESRSEKLFLKGEVWGKLRTAESSISFLTEINESTFGGARTIDQSNATIYPPLDGLGDQSIGDETVGDGGLPLSKYPFKYNFTLGKRGNDISVIFSSNVLSNGWEIDYVEIEYIEYERDSSRHF